MSNIKTSHFRKSIRLKEYDYSLEGAYFVTICTVGRKCCLGKISDGRIILTRDGKIVQQSWEDLTRHYENVILDMFIVMPNHLHGIVILSDEKTQSEGTGSKSISATKQRGAGEIIRGFKTFSTRKINAARGTPGRNLWQRNYFDRIVRNEKELDRIRKYILDNPILWELDHDNPEAKTVSKIVNPWDES